MDFFNPIDILDQTRDDACRKTPAYNLNAWRKAGGKDGQEPYFEPDTEFRGYERKPVIRVYVDAKLFPSWDDWKREAKRAETGAIMRSGHSGLTTFYGGPDYGFSGKPPFITEKVPSVGWRVWINILCPSESEFLRAVADAEAEMREIDSREKDDAAGLDSYFNSADKRTTRYCSLQNRRSDIDRMLDYWDNM